MRVLGRCAEAGPGFGFAVMHSRIFAWLGLGLLMVAPVAAGAGRETLHQWSTIDALLKGYYDGVAPLGEVLRSGDFGLGTLEGLDGELLIHEGRAYQIDSEGRVREQSAEARTPFAAVTRFDADIGFTVPAGVDLATLQARIEAALPSPNYICAVRVTGAFSQVKTRSVARQQKPYPPLTEVVKTQSVFAFAESTGVLVGFWCPTWVAGINVPGHHYHFLTTDRTGGGHVLGLVTGGEVRVELDLTPHFSMRLPTTAEFGALDLSGDRSAELHVVESDRK